ncbi:MAG: hypothetical protein RDV48_04540 [Candidatus Eremiobacteraeota bacterium]|nr:hypothetical protein [Candidatus Eremiobacteraeota bacterium]
MKVSEQTQNNERNLGDLIEQIQGMGRSESLEDTKKKSPLLAKVLRLLADQLEAFGDGNQDIETVASCKDTTVGNSLD